MIDETHGLFRGAGYLTHDGPIAALFGRIAALKLWQPWRTVNSRLTQTVRCHNCWPRKAHPCDRAVVFPSCGASERVKALNELHAQKVRALMKSVNSLKAKITKMTRDNKQNKLAVRIQGMQKQHREMELVVDVLKQMMCERQWSRAEVRRSAAAVAGLFVLHSVFTCPSRSTMHSSSAPLAVRSGSARKSARNWSWRWVHSAVLPPRRRL